MPEIEPKRLRILRAVKDLLVEIKQADGYWTNAGDHVGLGRLRLESTEEFPALVVNVARSETPAQGARVQYDLTVQVSALVKEDQDDPLAEAELVVGDIKRALFSGEDTLGGLVHQFTPGAVEPIMREDGTQFVGMLVEGLVQYTEKRGDPAN